MPLLLRHTMMLTTIDDDDITASSPAAAFMDASSSSLPSGTFLTETTHHNNNHTARSTTTTNNNNNNAITLYDDEEMSQCSRLHQKLHEMKRMDQQLEAMKQEYHLRMEAVKQGEQRFIARQNEMAESIRRFKAFIVETDTKRHRALRKADDERRQGEKCAEQIVLLTEKLETQKRRRDEVIRVHQQLEPNEEYLQSVLTHTDAFFEIDELLNRYHILHETNLDLREQAVQAQQGMVTTQNALQTLLKSKQNEVLVRNSHLAELQQQLEDRYNNTNSLENTVENMFTKARSSISRFGQVYQSVQNLYQRIISSRQHSVHARKRTHTYKFEEFINDAEANGKKKDRRGRKLSTSSSNNGSGEVPKGTVAGFPATSANAATPSVASTVTGVTTSRKNQALLRYLNTLLDEIGGRIIEIIDITTPNNKS